MGFFSKKNYDLERKKPQKICCEEFVPGLFPPDCHKAQKPLQLNEKEQFQYNIVLDYFQQQELNSSSKEGRDTLVPPLEEYEKLWLTKECITRFLRAAQWDANSAIENLTKTIIWRRSVGSPFEDALVSYEVIAKENENGRLIFLGYDKNRRLVCLLKYKSDSIDHTPTFKQLQQIVWFSEQCSILSLPDSEKIILLVDFASDNASSEPTSSQPFSSLSFAKQIIHVLQNHYPERLEMAIVQYVPPSMWPFLKLIHPLLDPNTRRKLIFGESFEKFLDFNHFDLQNNVHLHFHHDMNSYWTHLKNIIEQRRQNQINRFRSFGGTIGLSEFDIKMES